MLILLYSLLLALALLLSAPWWLFRMATTSRYREGLMQRLGRVPAHLRNTQNKRTLWLHTVSVGELLAATRLVTELEAALGENCRIVISTTTRTGQTLARARFGSDRVFYMPLDFAFAIRPYLNALQPAALLLMESELWPRMLHECARRNIPVAVVNARISDRSFARALRIRFLWKHILRKPTLWLAQSEQDATRLRTLIDLPQTPVILSEAHRAQSKDPETTQPTTTSPTFSTKNHSPTILTPGNLKYDIRAPKHSELAERLRQLIGSRPVIVAGSTTAAVKKHGHNDEEDLIIGAWLGKQAASHNALLIVAPRHPERFSDIAQYMRQIKGLNVSELASYEGRGLSLDDVTVLCLDTIGDLASVYGLATIAFVGGSLVPRNGHNPLEPAQFGVPVIMGPHFENFREVVGKMQQANAIRIVANATELKATFLELLSNPTEARALGERGRAVYESQSGATARTVTALLAMIGAPQ